MGIVVVLGWCMGFNMFFGSLLVLLDNVFKVIFVVGGLWLSLTDLVVLGNVGWIALVHLLDFVYH